MNSRNTNEPNSVKDTLFDLHPEMQDPKFSQSQTLCKVLLVTTSFNKGNWNAEVSNHSYLNILTKPTVKWKMRVISISGI